MKELDIAVIGAGPAGLFASECLLEKGFRVSVYDRMPAAGCKFLVAGNHGGLNITNDAAPEDFAARYGANAGLFARFLRDFSPEDMKKWLSSLGVSTSTGSGGKVFPGDGTGVSAILSRWIERLASFPGFAFYPRHRLVGLGADRVIRFETEGGIEEIAPRAALFALGGASWPKTGSDGAWNAPFMSRGIGLAPFLPANCGFEADWSDFLKAKFSNVPLKNITMTAGGKAVRGELMLTPYGLEGGVIYTLGASIRDEISRSGFCIVHIDLLPDRSPEKIAERLAPGPGNESLANYYRKRLGLEGAAFTLLREGAAGAPSAAGVAGAAAICAESAADAAAAAASAERGAGASGAASVNAASSVLRDPGKASGLIKRLPVTLYRTRPIEEAISSAGGVRFAGLDENLMLTDFPGWFCAGEMLDWESPTGGFLLQGCFSTAFRAARGIESWLSLCTSSPI